MAAYSADNLNSRGGTLLGEVRFGALPPYESRDGAQSQHAAVPISTRQVAEIKRLLAEAKIEYPAVLDSYTKDEASSFLHGLRKVRAKYR